MGVGVADVCVYWEGGGVSSEREREKREVGPKSPRSAIERKKRRKKDSLAGRERTGGGCCVGYDNLKLFDGITTKKPNARILPWPSHRLQQWVCVWRLLYNSFSMMRFSFIAWFSLLPPFFSHTPSQHWQVYSFNLRRRCPSHTGFFW